MIYSNKLEITESDERRHLPNIGQKQNHEPVFSNCLNTYSSKLKSVENDERRSLLDIGQKQNHEPVFSNCLGIHQKIIIVGAGPIGLILAYKLLKLKQEVIIIDDKSPSNDNRALAIANSAIKFLQIDDLWPQNLATAITKVEITHSGFANISIAHQEYNLDNLGATIKYNDLINHLSTKLLLDDNFKIIKAKVTAVESLEEYSIVNYQNSQLQNYTISCNLLLLAEGGNLLISGIDYFEKNYQSSALVASIAVNDYHNGIAHERFHNDQNLALLPHAQGYTMIWTFKNKELLQLQPLNSNFSSILETMLNQQLERRLGKLTIITPIQQFKLKLKIAKTLVYHKIILLGNSAQTIHPVSAQGLNLGLRDVANFIELYTNYDNNLDHLLNNYAAIRNNDRIETALISDLLATHANNSVFKKSRSLAFTLLKNFPLIKHTIIERLIYGKF